ncbi:DNA polymerase I [Desulfobacter hydrogenophilus]|uniref:DNA polymerase I n=1 Tax=Desulfobacter hydrogenophilus TaxID=2291 RepID=A0A328FAG8_9BACT|nr:DNA polymerase I [Desulfobacter hydrogenophilus]NDY74326.1 DNA polymerase I [Desulfobacter hydrogenophilus]QBH11851.1 DNA polymerase I [Desulfobacter hydrogenophilus]RAM00115.1 DNA polymerase I [Desulfobacter hydrogenophilus]
MAVPSTIYLIDGSAFVYRAFHAIRSLATSKGHPTNATFGFTRILLKLLKDKQPRYAGVFFDVKGPTFRHKIFDEYKANRPPMPEELAIQIPDIKAVTKALNIPIIEKTGYEADDLVGTYARIAQKQGFKVVMVTGDKDFIQLITDDCSLWDPMKDTVTDRSGVKEQMGIEPEQFIDVLGLAGDTSDNIPGVKGVGVKTAVKLIVEYGSISSIYKNLGQLKKKKKLHENLTASKKIVDLSRELATIDRHVDVGQSLNDFQLQEFDTRKAFELFQSFEFKALASEFSEKADKSTKTYKMVHTVDDMEHLVAALEKKGIFAIDTETTGIEPMRADLVGLSFSYEDNTGFYIPVGHTNTGGIQMPEKEEILRIFKPLLENSDIAKVGQNIKYDFIILARYGIEIKGIVFDTMIASHLLNPGTRGHGLDRIAMNLFGHKMISYEEVTGKGKDQIGFQEVPLDLAADYAAEDADLTFMAYGLLKKQIEDKGLTPLMETIEVPLICVLAKMEMAGIRVDTDVLGQMSLEFAEELKTLEQKIYELAGEEFNINSPQQLGVILFEKLGLKTVKKTRKKTGYSTDVDVLTQLANTHEMPEKLLRYRTLGKLKSTYVDALSSLVHPDTGRIHTSFNQTITVTGRLSSSNPNLQNIPIRKPEGKKIRQAFIPADGCTLISADYSQIELRLLAHCAKDPILIESFQNDEDIHTRTALEVFQVLPGLVTDEMRSQAKSINFGIIYGMSAFRLSNELGISRKMASIYIDNYFKRYAGVKAFIDKTIEQTRETCEVSTLFGRKRRLDDIRSSNANLRNFAQRAAVNTPIQGSAADLIKLAMIKMQTALATEKMESKMLLSVHDEIIFESPEQEKDKLMAMAKQVMENVTPLKVPLKVNFGAGANWAEAEH